MSNLTFEKKARFIYTKLLPMVLACEPDVDRLNYEACGEDETVVIRYTDGYARRVTVTGDSHIALARDVLREV